MARGKFEYWLTDDGLTLLEGWARDGLTDEQISQNMGINPATLYRYKQNYSKICEALKRGKEIIDYEVENSLLQAAKDGNTTAQIFWLKNRRPDKWRDKPVIDADREVMGKMDALLKEFNDAVKRETN